MNWDRIQGNWNQVTGRVQEQWGTLTDDDSTSLPAAVTSLQEDVATLNRRIAKAEVERDAWLVAGWEEKYLEAYCLVEALELQLAQRRKELEH